jgi:hypothetical protein
MKPIPSQDSLADYRIYRKADLESFELLYGFLKQRGYQIDPGYGKARKAIRDYDAFAWRADQPTLFLRRNGKVDCTQIVHQGIHHLVGSRFGYRLRGNPRMCLLNEAIGLGLGFYFPISMAANHGLEGNNYFTRTLADYVKAPMHAKVPLVKMLNDAISDPYRGFVKVTVDAYTVLLETFSHLLRLQAGEPATASWRRLEKVIRKSTHYTFTRRYDIALPSTYALAYCGERSSLEDRRNEKACLAILHDCGTMPELLSELGADAADHARVAA